MDGFTAGILLGAAKNGANSDEVAEIYKSLKSNEDDGPSAEAIAFVEANKGKPCKVAYTSHIGVIHGLNTARSGFYPGSRFPVYVKISNGEAAGRVLEYDLEQVVLVEEGSNT